MRTNALATLWYIFGGYLLDIVTCLQGDVIIETTSGLLKGVRVIHNYRENYGAFTKTVVHFRGIPYGAPPIGELRFKPPKDPHSWKGIRNATEFGPICPQLGNYTPELKDLPMSEDCLFLNIYSPMKENDSKKYPVIVFVHGGSFEVGTGQIYDGSVLAARGAVVVTINYRLGALGFLSTGDEHIPGNYGLLDIVQSLKWVRDNIANFGGDPQKVVVWGHSAGGAAVGLLMVVPQARGLFHGVIAESGCATSVYGSRTPEDLDIDWYLTEIGKIYQCPNMSRGGVADCLRALPYQEIVNNRDRFPLFNAIEIEFTPMVDGITIPESPPLMFQDGNFYQVPVITGTVEAEFNDYFKGGQRYNKMYDHSLDVYVSKVVGKKLALVVQHYYTYCSSANDGQMYYRRGEVLSDMHMVAPTDWFASVLARGGSSVYLYHWNDTRSYHSADLNYLLGAPFSGIYADEISMLMRDEGKNFQEEDRILSKHMMDFWISFADRSHPSLYILGSEQEPGLVWHPYSPNTKPYLYLSPQNQSMDYKLRYDKVIFWNNLIEEWKKPEPVPQESKTQSSATPRGWIVACAILLGLLVVAVVVIFNLVYKMSRRRPMIPISQNARV